MMKILVAIICSVIYLMLPESPNDKPIHIAQTIDPELGKALTCIRNDCEVSARYIAEQQKIASLRCRHGQRAACQLAKQLQGY